MDKSNEIAPRRSVVGPVIWTTIHALLWLALFIVLFAVVPRYQRTFDDFDTELPYLTQLVIAAGSFAWRYWYLLVVMWAGGVIGDFLLLWTFNSKGATWACHIWGAMIALLAAVLVGGSLLAIWLPLASVMRSLA